MLYKLIKSSQLLNSKQNAVRPADYLPHHKKSTSILQSDFALEAGKNRF